MGRFAVLLMVLGTLMFLIVPISEAQHPNLQAAWDAFGRSQFEKAMTLADKCVDDYSITATKMEADLEAKKAPPPPTGAVGQEEKKEILIRGPLNDAAACNFIKGRSAQSLAKTQPIQRSKLEREAREAYEAGCKLKYARIWDPQGWFWSPSDEVCERLKTLAPAAKARRP